MAITQTELKSSFLKDVVEEEEYKANVKAIQDWLTSQTQAASSTYRAQAQTAAEQASYDISGAYANYLKQQRNIASQGRLESGYKEEVGDVLQQQYQGAYSQARATQAENVASAQAGYLKNVQAYQETASKAATSYYESALKEAELRANIYKAAEEYANIGNSTLNVYDIDPTTGKYTLTDWGYEQLSRALLGDEGGFKSYLEEQKLTDELEYYLADPTGTHERLFGITETGYDPLSEESYKRRFSATGVDETGQLVTYVDTLQRPTLDLNWNDFSNVDFGKSGQNKFVGSSAEITKYATTQLGLTEEEILEALSGGRSHFDKPTDLQKYLEQQAKNIRGETVAEEKFNEILTKLETYAKSKYTKE